MTHTSPAPFWAVEYIGVAFLPERAVAAGWIDQNSSYAHYGFEQRKGLWLLKNSSPLPNNCHQTFWRFVLLEVDRQSTITSVSCQVAAVFPDGHGELVGQDLLNPADIAFAKAALVRATRDDGSLLQPVLDDWFKAAREGDTETVKRLLESGVDPNAADREGIGALGIAIQNGHGQVVTLLLGAGADPDSGAPKGFTPLMLAVRENQAEVVDLLIAAKSKINVISGQTWMTALMFAACPRKNRIIRKLLAAKAQTFLASSDGKTAADLYKECGDGDVFSEAIYAALED
jgi:uncharacterized protein